MIESYSFTSINPGKRTLILGSIHGDEVCGSIAIDNIVREIRSGSMQITGGSVTFIPRANPIAYKKGIRQDRYNLNRIFGPREMLSPEHQIAKIIEEYIRRSHFVLDLHSTHTSDDPFMMLESSGVEAQGFISESPFQNILLDWDKLYKDTGGMDTIAYASSQGISGVTVECGQHNNPDSVQNALRAIRHALGYFSHTDDLSHNADFSEKKLVFVKEIVWRGDNAKFTRIWKNFDVIKQGELIGTSENGSHVAPYDGYIIIPKPEGLIGDEWYYIGIGKTS